MQRLEFESASGDLVLSNSCALVNVRNAADNSGVISTRFNINLALLRITSRPAKLSLASRYY